LGIATLLTAWAHFLLFVTAVSLRKDTIAYDLLLPEFGKGIYFIAVSLGWFAVIGLTLVALAGLLRSKSGGIWKHAHRLSLVVFLLALVHAQMIGSEARGGTWFIVHLLFAGAVLTALIRRFVLQRTQVHY
jgi:predicted ferric reductase